MRESEQQRRADALQKAKADPAWKDLTAEAQRRLTKAIMTDTWPTLSTLG